MKILYDNIVTLLEEQHKNIHLLELEAELGNGTIGKWKNGSKPALESVMKVAKVLGVTVDQLITED